MGVNVAQILRQGALRHPERVALVVDDGASRAEYGYGALEARARRVAHLLRGQGVGPGTGVLLCAGNGVDFVAAWFGVLYTGGFVVPAPVLSAAPELRHRAQHAGCRVALCDAARRAVVELGVASLPGPVQVHELQDLAADPAAPALDYPADTEPGDPAMVLYTSGTTGTPKGAVITHASLVTHTAVMAQHTLRLDSDDCVMGVLPLTHSYGCRMVMLASLYVGARAVLMPRFDAARSLEAMGRHGVSWLPAVPTMFAAWGALPDGPPPGRLRWALSAGAPLADQTAVRAERRLGAEVRQGFGMTEATFSTLNAPPDARVLGSVGRPVWGIELRIVDERGRDQPAGQAGELWVRGHNVMGRYLHDPEATEQARSDGWMRSGDVGVLDGQGRLRIVDRLKDMIIRGGNNVYPSEVEAVLVAHPDVVQAAVVGRPDDYYGEEVVAVVVPRAGASLSAATLYAHAQQNLARTKLPRLLAMVEKLPLGPSGKVLKRTLRAQLMDGTLVAEPVRPQDT